MTPIEVADKAAQVAAELPRPEVEKLVEALSTEPAVVVRHLIDTRVPPAARPALRALLGGSCDPAHVAIALATAAVTHERLTTAIDRTELVWTGPPTIAVPVRPTQTVVHDLIATAEQHITLATYSAGDVSDIVSLLNQRRKEPGFDIRLLLELPRRDGTGPDSLGDFARIAPYVTTLCWPRQARENHDYSNMHVKVLIKDRSAALVTSANISKAARSHNMELGVLVTGPDLPARLRSHFDELEDEGLIKSPAT